MQQLNFPEFEFKIRNNSIRDEIYDPVRRKFVALTPEEWVRQHVIAFLVKEKGYPFSSLGIEKKLLINKQLKRFDLVLFLRNGDPFLLVECKAPGVEITEKTFDQAARYNMQLKAEYFLITNGFDHYFCRLDYLNKQYVFIENIPSYAKP
jgi:hypothetical protein